MKLQNNGKEKQSVCGAYSAPNQSNTVLSDHSEEKLAVLWNVIFHTTLVQEYKKQY